MPTSRILLKQGGVEYRFLRFEQSPDGSIIIVVDRDTSPSVDGRTFENGQFVPAMERRDKVVPHGRWTVHTTGIVNYHHAGRQKSRHVVEPLYAITSTSLIGFVSVPKVSRLSPLDGSKKHAVSGVLEISPEIDGRVTFSIEIAPGPINEGSVPAISLNFETYSVVVKPAPLPMQIDDDMSDHFVYVAPPNASHDVNGIDAAEAELKFYERIHGQGVKIYRDEGGTYVILTAVVMNRPPKLNIAFDREDLHIELIPSQQDKAHAHKLRFWICDKGGRNKTDDLRCHIVSVELDARL